jgi:hypothetical protein
MQANLPTQPMQSSALICTYYQFQLRAYITTEQYALDFYNKGIDKKYNTIRICFSGKYAINGPISTITNFCFFQALMCTKTEISEGEYEPKVLPRSSFVTFS